MKYFCFVFVTLVFLVGCGSGKSNPGGNCCDVPGINVEVVSPVGPAGVDANQGQTVPITVQVTGDSSNAGVTWTLTPAVTGSTTEQLADQATLTATYNPPLSFPKGVTWPLYATVTATSKTDPTRSAVIPISVYPPLTAYADPSYLGLATAFLNANYTCIGPGDTQIACEAGVLGGPVDSTGNPLPDTWSLGNSPLPPGLQLAPSSSLPASSLPPYAASAIAIVGTPTAAGIYSFSLTATDATGNAITQPFTINVAPAQLKVVTPTVMEFVPSVQDIADYAPYAPIQLQASGGVPPYTWGFAPGVFTSSNPQPSGLHLSSSGVISLDSSYVPPSSGFAVQVMDSQSPVPAQAVFPAPGSSSLILIQNSDIDTSFGSGLNGCPTLTSEHNLTYTSMPPNTAYAFAFSGFGPGNVPVTFSGSFTVADDNGDIGGVEDIIPSIGSAQLAHPLLNGSSVEVENGYSNHGCLTLTTAANSTAQFRLVPTVQPTSGAYKGAYTAGDIIEFDDTNGTGTRGSGYFRMQTSAAFATPASSFAFRLSGWDASANHFAMAGAATAAAQAGSFSVSGDVNDGGLFSGPLTGGTFTFGAPDTTTGRGTASLTLSTGAAAYNLIYYIVDANHLIFNSAQPVSTGQPLITGEATASAGPFSQATLSNSHIYHFGGDVSGSPDVGVGVLHFDGSGAVSGTNYERSGGTTNTTTLSAQYAVDPTTGRFSFSGTGAPVAGYAVVTSASEVTGYLVGTGASAASGTMEFQTSSYSAGYQIGPIIGNYGLRTEEMLDPQTTAIVGNEYPARNGQFASPQNYVDYLYSSNLTGLTPFQEFDLFKYTWNADGSGTYGGYTYMVTNGSKFFYIDTSPLNAHPAVVVGQCWEDCQSN